MMGTFRSSLFSLSLVQKNSSCCFPQNVKLSGLAYAAFPGPIDSRGLSDHFLSRSPVNLSKLSNSLFERDLSGNELGIKGCPVLFLHTYGASKDSRLHFRLWLLPQGCHFKLYPLSEFRANTFGPLQREAIERGKMLTSFLRFFEIK